MTIDVIAKTDLPKFAKRWIKEMFKGENVGKRDRLTHSMRDGMRYERMRYEGDGESWTEYGFITPDDILFDYDPCEFDSDWDAYLSLTDEEIEEWVQDNMVVRIYSKYDCTGRAFTAWIDWHRNPSGWISYQHHMALDI